MARERQKKALSAGSDSRKHGIFLEMTHLPLVPARFFNPEQDDIEIDDTVNIVGIIDADYEVVSYKDQPGITTFRISLQIGHRDLIQALVEIHCPNTASEPKLAPNFRSFQLFMAKNCKFSGTKVHKGLSVDNFRINATTLDDRFIWLSNSRMNFWTCPFGEPYNPKACVLDKSEGSVFGKNVRDIEKDITCYQPRAGPELGPWYFPDMADVAKRLKNDVKVFPQKLVLSDDNLVHPTIKTRTKMYL